MQWLALPRGLDAQPGGVLELSPEVYPAGLALKLQVDIARPRGLRPCGALEDGRVLRKAVVGTA